MGMAVWYHAANRLCRRGSCSTRRHLLRQMAGERRRMAVVPAGAGANHEREDSTRRLAMTIAHGTTHPPFDPELEAALGLIQEELPASMTADQIPRLRASLSANPLIEPTLEMLRERVDVEERTVPGPAGAPDISLIILRPRGVQTAVPGVYHTHGGGMVMGSNK